MTSSPKEHAAHDASTENALVRRHLLVGWSALLLFALLGSVLETMHAFKVATYLDADQETRRLMFRLAHAHGTLLGVLHVALSWTFVRLGRSKATHLTLISYASTGALLLLPLGFLLGGFGALEGDPGVGIVLVPVGAVLLLFALGRVVLSLRQS